MLTLKRFPISSFRTQSQKKCFLFVATKNYSFSKYKVKTLKALPFDLEYSNYIIGKGIIIFTFTYCSLNWIIYNRINKDIKK